jgi:anti-sigma factor RsiW
MSEPDPAELSAFLDGELDPIRAKQIEALLAADPEMRAAFEQLDLADRRLRSVAAAAAFRPRVRWPEPAEQPATRWLVLPLAAVLLAWAIGKLIPTTMTVSLVINAAALLLLVACLAPLAVREARAGEPFAT